MANGWSDSAGPWGAPTWFKEVQPQTKPHVTIICVIAIVVILFVWSRYA